MGRLIAFDQQTASALVAGTRTAAQMGHGSPLKAAIGSETEATLLMPSRQRDELLVVQVRRPVQSVQAPAAKPEKKRGWWLMPDEKPFEPVSYQATGFLGLEDEPIYTEEPAAPPPPKKKWWKF